MCTRQRYASLGRGSADAQRSMALRPDEATRLRCILRRTDAIVGATAEVKEREMSTDTQAESQLDVQNDRRLDPRVKRALRGVPSRALDDIDSRERLIEISNSESAQALAAKLEDLYARFDTADVAPFDGLRIQTREFASTP